jgi:hypothetical protein
MNIAQINIAQMKAPLNSDLMKEFRDFLAPVNLLAESSPGFIWRYQDGNAHDFEYPWENDMLIVNMSVWENVETLENFTYKTVHSYFLQSKRKWFNQLGHPHSVLWWIEEGHIPTLVEAKAKLTLFEKSGPTKDAFLFAQVGLFKP